MIISLNLRPKPFFLLHLRWLNPKALTSYFHSLSQTRLQQKPIHEQALVSALKCCALDMAVSHGQQLHGLVLKSGVDSNTFVLNSVLNMYAKSGFIEEAESVFKHNLVHDVVSCNIMLSGYVRSRRLEDARRVFDEMSDRNCVSYTTMIMGFSQNSRWSEAVEMFKDMRNVGVETNEVCLTTVISACSHLGGIWNGRILHCLAIKYKLDGLVRVNTNLLHMYCICSSLGEARKLFDTMPERNLVSWNVMLNGYSKAGTIELARKLFDQIPSKDVVSFGTMIDGYVQADWLREALMLYREMIHNGAIPSDVMIVNLLSACGRSLYVKEGLQFHSTIIKTGFDCSDFIQATVIHFYAACGEIELAISQFQVGIKKHTVSRNALMAGLIRNKMIDKAKKLFDETQERDVFSWSTIISGYTQNEQPHIALELFHEMVASGVKATQITMVSVFSAIASLGRLDEGEIAHEYVRHNSIPLNDNVSAAIIDMYAKCGNIKAGLQLFHQVRDKASTVSPWNAIICGLAMHGSSNLSLEVFFDLQHRPIKPNSITFIGALSACCHAGLAELGEDYFKRMRSEYGIEPDIKHYGCMVDMLGRAGRLEEAEEMIMTMPVKADVVIWGTLLAACRTHGNVDVGERAANNLAILEPCHGGSKVLLSNIYADAGRWKDVFSVRKDIQTEKIRRLPGYSEIM